MGQQEVVGSRSEYTAEVTQRISKRLGAPIPSGNDGATIESGIPTFYSCGAWPFDNDRDVVHMAHYM